jgi:hypothetical protein
MSIFAKPTPTAKASPELVRSRYQEILDCMNQAYQQMDRAATLHSSLIHDLEKGLRFIDKFRVDLTQAIGENGGKPEVNVEEAIKDYIPRAPSVE